MALKSSIEWTESTWNPVTGCTKVSPGCKHCYAEKMARRLQAIGHVNYKNGFKPTVHRSVLGLPLKWKKPQKIFVNSMSDLFHEDISVEFILHIFETMHKADWHIYQLLTKRSKRLIEINQILKWKPNIWMGVTVENKDYKYRIDDLRKTNAHIKFISFEPLIAPIEKLDLRGIDWVIVGGESGPGARIMEEEWVLEIKEQCIKQGISFFFKQWGGFNRKKTGRLLEGRAWDEIPAFSFANIYANGRVIS